MNTADKIFSLDSEVLNACVSCGLCLPHCPTYRVTGDERLSPRGRISLMRISESSEFVPTQEWINSMDTCVQCLGCETACPSSVQFGDLISETKKNLRHVRKLPISVRCGLKVIARPFLLKVSTFFISYLQKLGLFRNSSYIPSGVPSVKRKLSVDDSTGEPVLFTGCVMNFWTPWVHEAALKSLKFFGVSPDVSGNKVGCCGALHEHSGLTKEFEKMAQKVIEKMPDTVPILVNSAGCGAVLKEYGTLLKTDEAKEFSKRVFDVHEWMAVNFELPKKSAEKEAVIVQDPCHLRHVQNSHHHVRDLLDPFLEIVELSDDGLCCGAGGVYSLTQRELSTEIRQLKSTALNEVMKGKGTLRVASANPGCVTHLQAEGFEMKHPLELVADYLSEMDHKSVEKLNEF